MNVSEMTRDEIAGTLGVSPSTITLWREEGLPSCKKGHATVYDGAAVLEWYTHRQLIKDGVTVQIPPTVTAVAELLSRLYPGAKITLPSGRVIVCQPDYTPPDRGARY